MDFTPRKAEKPLRHNGLLGVEELKKIPMSGKKKNNQEDSRFKFFKIRVGWKSWSQKCVPQARSL